MRLPLRLNACLSIFISLPQALLYLLLDRLFVIYELLSCIGYARALFSFIHVVENIGENCAIHQTVGERTGKQGEAAAATYNED